METKRLLARNVAWNWVGMAVGMAAAVVVMPFLIHRLGETTYGLWILIGSLTNYFGLMDLGIRGSVGRYIAFHRAKDDQDGVNRTLSTASAILVAIALLALVGTLALQLVFFHLFDVPSTQEMDVRVALLLVGVNLALSFPLSVFDGTLWAFQRFDLLNIVDIPVHFLRVGLTIYWIGNGGGLVALALLVIICNLVGGLAKAILCFRQDPKLRLAPRLVEKTMAWALFTYGIWSFLQAMSVMVTTQMSLLIIGAWLTVAMVTTYHVALRLVNIASAFMMAGSGVLTPLATTLHAGDKHQQQQRLFLDGGKFTATVALYFLVLLVFLGRPLIQLWVGPELLQAADLLVILAVGQFLPLSQRVTNSMILGMGKHKFMALVGIGESVAGTLLALLLVGPFGLFGVCVAFVIVEFVAQGVILLVYGCRLAEVPVWRYLKHSILTPLAIAALPALGLALFTHWWTPASWLQLIATSGVFSLVYGAVAICILVPGWLQRGRFFFGAGKKTPDRCAAAFIPAGLGPACKGID